MDLRLSCAPEWALNLVTVMDFLNLSSLEQNKIHEDEHNYHIEARSRLDSPPCPHCGSAEAVGFGRKRQLFMDAPVRGKRVGIWVVRRRLRCRACARTFMESLPDMDLRRQATKRLVRFIEHESLRRTFSSLGEDTGCDEKTIRNIFRDYVRRLERTMQFETPKWLGIDEIHLLKKPRCVLTNIGQQTVVDLLANRNKARVIKRLQALQGREQVRYVAMDMWTPYRGAVQTVLPHAKVVVDKFHIVRMANQCMEGVRKSLRKSLEPKLRRGLMHDRFVLLKRQRDLTDKEVLMLSGWCANFPELSAAYEAKEAFFGIWEMDNRPAAKQAYALWHARLPEALHAHFKPILTAVGNWREELFNYFDHPITNAYTESLNNLIRVTNRIGRGYSFKVLRAKMLFTRGNQAIEKPKFPKQQPPTEGIVFKYIGALSGSEHPREVSYGARISTLASVIESGQI